MALFKSKEGGLLDVIRCDEPSYLIWKWRPAGEANGTKKENAIRYGSSLRVKDGEVAVFVYRQKDGTVQDFIEGPFDKKIETANFPVLASIVGLAFGGGSPFQAEIYFINLARIIQINFGVPYFDVFDPRFLDFAVPVAVRGTITFRIPDYRAFIKLHRLVDFDFGTFTGQIRDAVTKYVKGVVANVPADCGIPVAQMERKIMEINAVVENHLKARLENDFGVSVTALDIGAVEPDKESEGWLSLMAVTKEITGQTTIAQAEINVKNLQDMQEINAANMAATLQAQREELQYAQRMQTNSSNFALHQLNQQTNVAMAGAEAMGKMGEGGATGGGTGGGGMNPGAMLAGMMLGGSVGGQMAGMMGNMMQGVQQGMPPAPGSVPPPPPQVQYSVAENGQAQGPFDLNTLTQMAQSGRLTPQSQVWKQGMAGWVAAGTVAELSGLFAPAGGTVNPPPIP